MVDWDEDGDVDLLCGEYSGYITFFENVGTVTSPELRNRGHLTANGVVIDVGTLSIPVVHDWNEDGMKDLVVGNDPAYIRVYLNVGANAAPVFNTYFQIPTTPSITQIKNAPDVGDLNGDGLKDLAFGWWQGTVVYYPNSGTNASPFFNGDHELTAVGTLIDPGGWTHLELNDWDEDGDLDLVYGEWNGQVYIHYNLTGEFVTEIQGSGTPIQIPASGGSFEFNAYLANNSEYPADCDIWTVALLPNGNETGALLLVSPTLASGAIIDRDRVQNVPANAPAGNYEYILRMGVYPDDAWAEASLPFEKLAADDGSATVDNWDCLGESFDSKLTAGDNLPVEHVLLTAYPNPFNPETTINFELLDASDVNLTVYDISGREVQSLVTGHLSPGQHSVVWDADGMPSGVYFVRLEAGGYTATQKLVYMK